MNKYYPVLLSFAFLIPCADIKPMNYSDSTKDKILLASMVVGLMATGYGFFRFLTWWKPLQSKPKSKNTQTIGNIKAAGDVCVRQAGAGDNVVQVVGNVVGGKISITQDAGESNSLQVVGNTVGGDISINQSGGNNRISGNSITTNGSFVASQDQSIPDAIGSIKTKSMMLMGDQFLQKIIVHGIGQLLIAQNKSLKNIEASITAEKSIIENFSVVKEGNNLVIGPKKNAIIRSAQNVIYKLYMPQIPQLFIQGNIKAQFVTEIKQDRLGLNLQDNGTIDCPANCPIDVKKLITSVIGNSTVYLHGIAPRQTIILKDNARYNALEIRSHSVKVKGFDNGQADLLLEDSPGDLYAPVRSKIKGELHGNSKLSHQGSNPINKIICHDNAGSFTRIE